MATNLERTDIVLGMDIEGGKPASLLKTNKKKDRWEWPQAQGARAVA